MEMMNGMRRVIHVLLLGSLLSGCSTDPVRAAAPAEATVAGFARQLLGRPYRYGGTSPGDGFDCSGLVWYAYRQAGYSVPRTTSAQFDAARPVDPAGLLPGDVLFFRIAGKPSHVGLYVGEGRFIHAPSSGKRVRYDALAGPYWQSRLVKAGRFR